MEICAYSHETKVRLNVTRVMHRVLIDSKKRILDQELHKKVSFTAVTISHIMSDTLFFVDYTLESCPKAI